MDDWLHKHLTQILLRYVGEVRVRWRGKDLSQHSFAATRRSSYLETKWTAGMGSSSSICTYYSSDMCLRVFMIFTASHKRVLKSPSITRKISSGESHNFFLDFQWGLRPLLISCSTKEMTIFLCWSCQNRCCFSDKGILLILFLFTLTQILPLSLQGLHTHLLPHSCVLLQHSVGEEQKLWPGKWNAKFKMLSPALPARLEWGCHACTSRNTHLCAGTWSFSWDTVRTCGSVGKDQGQQHRGSTKHLLEILKLVPHDFRDWWWRVFCSFVLFLGFHVSDVLPCAGRGCTGLCRDTPRAELKPWLSHWIMLSWHAKMFFWPFPQ